MKLKTPEGFQPQMLVDLTLHSVTLNNEQKPSFKAKKWSFFYIIII